MGEITAKEAFEYERIKSLENFHYGFKNLKGEWVIKPIYYSASHFAGGVATVNFNFNDKIGSDGFITEKSSTHVSKYGLIDPNGKFVLPLEYDKLSDPWHNHFEDEVSISGLKKDIGYAIYDAKGKIIYGPIQKYNGNNILRLEPYKNDHFVIEYYPKNYKSVNKHISDGYQTACDIVHKNGKVAIKQHEFICQAVDENGYFGYTNYNNCVAMIFAEATPNGVKNKISGVQHVNGKVLFHQNNGNMSKDNGSFDCWNFRENPKDPNKERDANIYYSNLTITNREFIRNGEKLFEQDLVAKYNADGKDVGKVFERDAFKIFTKTNGGVRDGKDIIRFNHMDSQGKFAGTALYSISLDKLIYVDYNKLTIGNFAENRFFVPKIGYVVEKAN
jgi:hypothetical protein